MRLAKRRKVRPDDPVAVVTRFLDAANHHDADGLRACVHPEFESFQPLHPARNFRGAGQLISNWKAIFEAEPGFRLTLLRASTTGNTVWAEIHGAGASAEAAGIFIVGVEDGRIRWIRVYSDLVEPMPEEPVEEAPQPPVSAVDWDRDPIRLVPPRDVGDGQAVAEEEQAKAAGQEEPAEGDAPAVAAATADARALRLVGADPDGEAEAPAATADREAIEVLVGDASEVEVDVESTDEAPGPDPEAEAKEAVAEAEATTTAEAAEAGADDIGVRDLLAATSEDDDDAGSTWRETVAPLGGAGSDATGSETQPARRRLGFLRRGGRGGGS